MPNKPSDKKYITFSFEDFLLDDFFVSSMISRDEEAILFWENLVRENKVQQKEFDAARRFIAESQRNIQNNTSITDKDISNLWYRIENTNTESIRNSKRVRLKKQIYATFAAAACILIIFFTIPYFSKFHSDEKDDTLIKYATTRPINIDSISDIHLVLSDDKTILVADEESSISYDSTKIKISSAEEIEKENTITYNQLAVPKGKRSTLKLSDGTFMYVNAGTIVTYPSDFTGKKREIYVDGEIFIDVKEDRERPFIIKTSEMNIEVLGTKFNVTAYSTDDKKQVVLASGSVKVSSKNDKEKIVLKPSEMYQYEKGNSNIETVDLIEHIAWIEGLYYFESERLDNIMLRLSRYYGKEISFDREIASFKCSGKMDLKDDLNEVLVGLSFSFPIDITLKNDKYNITRK